MNFIKVIAGIMMIIDLVASMVAEDDVKSNHYLLWAILMSIILLH